MIELEFFKIGIGIAFGFVITGIIIFIILSVFHFLGRLYRIKHNKQIKELIKQLLFSKEFRAIVKQIKNEK